MIATLIERYKQRLAPPAARVHDPGPCRREVPPEGGLMFESSICPENRNRYTIQPGWSLIAPTSTGMLTSIWFATSA